MPLLALTRHGPPSKFHLARPKLIRFPRVQASISLTDHSIPEGGRQDFRAVLGKIDNQMEKKSA